mgnify:CR=1 FL=1
MARDSFHTGRGGRSFQDRELAARVRTLALEKIEEVLRGKDNVFRKAVILRLAGTVLPRLNEHTGEGGGPIPVQIDSVIAKKNNVASSQPENNS